MRVFFKVRINESLTLQEIKDCYRNVLNALDMVGLSQLHAFFKIRLYDFLLEYTLLKHLNLAPSYFKINFKLIAKPCSKNPNMF